MLDRCARHRPTAPSATTHENTADRLLTIADFHPVQSYLEVGVYAGGTFNAVNFPRKVAVDPNFMFDTRTAAGPGIDFHELRSDEYFTSPDHHERFDLIFLDGLHEFRQTLRDFINALDYSHAASVIVLDDVLPNDVFSALPDVSRAYRFRELNRPGNPDRSWHGDVYKVVLAIHDLFPRISYCTVNRGEGNPQTFCFRSPRRDFRPHFASLEQIERLSYFELLDHLDLLNPVSEDEAFQIVRAFSEHSASAR